MDLNNQAKAIQSEIDETFKSAYIALEKANIELGIKMLRLLHLTLP